jgi:eukaryotic-like serine/threonine-protein kinase
MSPQGITEIGKYRIIEQVGEGAMGVVYRATDPVLNRTVAVKVMCDAIARDDDLRGRFLREAQAAGSLQHPNVITIYDFGEVDGHLFIAMEFVEGEDLDKLLAKEVALSPVDKLDIIIDVLSGLAYAHKRGIVHRDIKPANIRIDDEGRARLMDFGIARISSSSLTRTGVMVGTPAYMAPEQIVGGETVPASDLFSVGTVLYELLTGSKPFQGESIQSVMYQIVSHDPPPLNSAKLGLPPILDTIANRALAKDVENRYSSALEMANALTEVRAGLDRAASTSKTVSLRLVIDSALADERAGKRRAEKRRTTLAIGAGVGALGIVALIAFLIVRFQTAKTTSLASAPPVVTPSGTPVAPPPSRPAPDSQTGPVSTEPAPKTIPKAPKSEATGPTSQELMLVRALQTTALEGRRRALEAGATDELLRPGDNQNSAAERLVAAGKVSDAAVKLNEATAAWAAAERDARANAAAANTRSKTSAVDSSKREVPSIPVSAPTVTPPQVATVKPPAPAANPSAEIESAVAAYARAIESRDIAEVRRAYPGITAAQASGFEQFFASVRSLHANFSVSSLDINGNTAEGKLAGTYDYLTTAGKSERQAVTFQASFRRGADGWKLASVR